MHDSSFDTVDHQCPKDKRMAGSYEIIYSLYVGDREIVFGINEQSETPYMCASCSENGLLRIYENIMVGDDYVEIIALYAERIGLQCETLRQAQMQTPTEKITPEMCHPNDYRQSIEGKIVAVKLSELRHEYRSAAHQLIYVTGGNGAKANARGSACFHYNLYTGENGRFERCDIQGEVKPEYMPAWAKKKLHEILMREQQKNKNREAR